MAWPKGKPRKAASMNDTPSGVDVAYLPGDGDPATITWRGIVFKANEPVTVTDADHIGAARENRFFRVGGEANDAPKSAPEDAMEYRAHVMDWIRDVTTVDELVAKWAGDRALREKCEVGEDDVRYLGTLIEPKLRDMRQAEGLSNADVANKWVEKGVLDLPWRA